MDVLEADLRKGCSILFDVLHTTILDASTLYGSSKGLVPDLQSISLHLKPTPNPYVVSIGFDCRFC